MEQRGLKSKERRKEAIPEGRRRGRAKVQS